MLREVGARAWHVAVVVLGCCAFAAVLVVVVLVETLLVLHPAWGRE